MSSKSSGLHAELRCPVTGREALIGETPWVGGLCCPKVLKGVTDDRPLYAELLRLSGEKDQMIG